MDDKIAKLQIATNEAETKMKKDKEALEDSQKRVDAAKTLLRELDEEEQNTIQVSDTKLPELLALHNIAKEEYESSEKRYETNKRYLTIYKEKLGGRNAESSPKGGDS
jgi:predicted  nucleic acid-binding Zn-ribbon protein